MELFGPEVTSLFEKYKEEMSKLSFHRKRQDEIQYWKTWDRILDLVKQFEAINVVQNQHGGEE